GEDWWYHNRGHFDIRLMRELSRGTPVLFVNSIGMRTPRPREGGMFIRRITRKLRSMNRGCVTIDDGFHVISPFAAPGQAGLRATAPILARQVRAAAKSLGMTRPLVWITVPTAAEVLHRIPHVGVVYQRTDRYEFFPDVDRERIERNDAWLKARADATVFCASVLHAEEQDECRFAALIDHGLDEQRFLTASETAADPDDVRSIPHPRVGFIGGVDSHTFDPELFDTVARSLPDVHFVLVGSCSLPAGWCVEPNVHLLGQRPYEDVHAYMAACDVLIMPWRQGPWIEACLPVKLKEYLAVGRPVVSTPFPELRRFESLVSVARSAESFAAAITAAIDEPGDAEERQAAVRGQSWSVKAQKLLNMLADRGLRPAHAFRLAAPVEPPVIHTMAHRFPSEQERARSISRRVRRDAVPDLAACLILDGGLRPSALVNQCGCSVLDLYVTQRRTLLDVWLTQLHSVARGLPVRVLHGVHGPPPWPRRAHSASVTIEREPQTFRGPAGVVADACRAMDDSARVLVVDAARLPAASLKPLLAAHARRGAALTIGCGPDGSPAGAYVATVESMRDVPSMGFVDFKEQWVARLMARGADIRTHRLESPGLPVLRTRCDVLRGLRQASGRPGFDELDAHGSIICAGATVEPGAIVLDSLIMPDAHIAAGALIVRSVITPQAVVKTGEDIADAVVSADSCLSDQDAGVTW
ncbi:MAG: glycosyltransferase, partial [Phycisphaerales bacterium]|nr:glycosyltransferase [Phycisphaerales bacterium]